MDTGTLIGIAIIFGPMLWGIIKLIIKAGSSNESPHHDAKFESPTKATADISKESTTSSSLSLSSGQISGSGSNLSDDSSDLVSPESNASGDYIKDPNTGKQVRHGKWVIIGPISGYLPKMHDDMPKEIMLIDKLAQKYAQEGQYAAIITEAFFDFGQPLGAWYTTHYKEPLIWLSFSDGWLDGLCYNVKNGHTGDMASYKRGKPHGIDLQIGWHSEIISLDHFLYGKAVGLSYRYDYDRRRILVHNHDTNETKSFALDLHRMRNSDISLKTTCREGNTKRTVRFSAIGHKEQLFIEKSFQDGHVIEGLGRIDVLGISELRTLSLIQLADPDFEIDHKLIEVSKSGLWVYSKKEHAFSEESKHCYYREFMHGALRPDVVRVLHLIETANTQHHLQSFCQYSTVTFKKHGPSYFYRDEETELFNDGKLYAFKNYQNGELHGLRTDFHLDEGFVQFTRYELGTPVKKQVIDTINKRLITLENIDDDWAEMSTEDKARCASEDLDLQTFAEVLQPLMITAFQVKLECSANDKSRKRKASNKDEDSANAQNNTHDDVIKDSDEDLDEDLDEDEDEDEDEDDHKRPRFFVQAYSDNFTLCSIECIDYKDQRFKLLVVDLKGRTTIEVGGFNPETTLTLHKLSREQMRHRDLPPVRLNLEMEKDGFWSYEFPDGSKTHKTYINNDVNPDILHIVDLKKAQYSSYCQFSKASAKQNGPSYYFNFDEVLTGYKEFKDGKLQGLVLEYHLEDGYIIVKHYANDQLVSPAQRVDIKQKQVLTLKDKADSWDQITDLDSAKDRYIIGDFDPELYDKIMEPTLLDEHDIRSSLYF